MQARDVMRKGVVFIQANDSLKDILTVLVKNNISGVPVIDENFLVIGMVTEKDLMTKQKGLDIPSYIEFVASILFIDGDVKYATDEDILTTCRAKDVMSSPVYMVNIDAPIEEVASIMVNRHVNRIPVVDKEGKLVGIIGRSDLLPLLIK